MHKGRVDRTGKVGGPESVFREHCTLDDCHRPHKAFGMCNLHYRRHLKHGDPHTLLRVQTYEGATCLVNGCDQRPSVRDYCNMHYLRWIQHGTPGEAEPRKQIDHPQSCTVDGCDRMYVTSGFCNLHYKRWLAHGDPTAVVDRSKGTCAIEECGKEHRARGWCQFHYQKWRTYGDPLFEVERITECVIDGCDGEPQAHGWCRKHYARFRRYGDPHHPVRVSAYPEGATCEIESCERPIRALNLCELHYDRLQTHGDPTFSMWEIDMDTPTTLYRLFNEEMQLLYVGISVRPLKRMEEHSRHKEWWPLVNQFLFTECDTRRDALDLEAAVIKNERPVFNIIHNNDDI